MGLQGKLVLSFMAVLTAALSTSCFLFFTHNRQRVADITGEEAKQLSTALALASEGEVREGRIEALRNAAQELIKGRNVVFVAFLDADAHVVAFASRDPDSYLQRTALVNTEARDLMQVRNRRSPVFGNYVQVVAPMFRTAPVAIPPAEAKPKAEPGATPGGAHAADAADRADAARVEQRLGGYVAVGMSMSGEETQLRRTMLLVVGVGCVLLLLCWPLAHASVHRITGPIRQLVGVTKQITGGDLDARVGTDRTDVIGELARSFNEMVIWVKKQQQDVAAANHKLADANRDLEGKVVARTAQLETAMQRLSKEIAEKEDFLRAVSHDLNAPLRNISGMATMLLMKYKEKFDEDVLHRLERIKKNVDVETDLIAELLELSRIKTRRQRMEPVDVESLVGELRGLFENDLRSRTIHLVVDTPLPVLQAERARLRQVFQNLIDNAIKYMGDGLRREIHVGCAPRAGEVEFYVRDTGTGIDPEDIDKVFFVFRRGKSVSNIAGKGVGLASVKSIVETYNGSIWVESALGEGTTFRFTINGKHVPGPAADPDEPDEAEEQLGDRAVMGLVPPPPPRGNDASRAA